MTQPKWALDMCESIFLDALQTIPDAVKAYECHEDDLGVLVGSPDSEIIANVISVHGAADRDDGLFLMLMPPAMWRQLLEEVSPEHLEQIDTLKAARSSIRPMIVVSEQDEVVILFNDLKGDLADEGVS